MSARREALMTRFRVSALERLATLGATLQPPLGEEPLAALKAGLHTIKGESRMLGLPSLATLVHAIEDWLADRPPPLDAETLAPLQAALGLLAERLAAALVEDEAAQAALERGRALLGGEASVVAEGTSPTPTPEPAAAPVSARPSVPPTASTRIALVERDTVDRVCEGLEQLRASLGALEARARTREQGLSGSELASLREECAELGELAWTMRMVAIEPTLRELGSYAEQLAERQGKLLHVEIDAGAASLERSLLEQLREPLVHLVHNAIDHGIEPPNERNAKPARARLRMAARSRGPEIELELEDDGRGIALEQVRARACERGLVDARAAASLAREELLALIFTTGFSTASSVGELSGRGIGLDVVRRVIEGLGGHVGVDSEVARGTRFTLRTPASLSRERVLVIEIADGLWGIPARRVDRILALRELEPEPETSSVRFAGEHLPLVSLSRVLAVESVPELLVLICSRGTRRYALTCPTLLGEHELVRRPLGPTLGALGLASASATLDDGRLVLLVEPAALIDLRHQAPREAIRTPRRRVLVVDDSAIVRELLVELLAAHALEVDTANDGEAALDKLARTRPDLVISDLEMPRVDGFELLARIRARDASLPVIISSTRSAPADRARAMQLGANAYFVKTEGEQNLLDAVARFVEVKP